MFQTRFTNNQPFSHPLSKVVCVGRNYAEHAKELNNPMPDQPILFIKPESSVVDMHQALKIPEHDCHYETEVAVLIGSELSHATLDEAERAVAGIGLALDLTRRELQAELKAKSHPWELAKAFDGACPLSHFIPVDQLKSLDDLRFSLLINDELRQSGQAQDMLTPIVPLIAHMSNYFTLRVGDVVLTGTPKGVGPLQIGARLRLSLNDQFTIETSTIA